MTHWKSNCQDVYKSAYLATAAMATVFSRSDTEEGSEHTSSITSERIVEVDPKGSVWQLEQLVEGGHLESPSTQ